MQVRWWHGALVLGLCVGSYTIGTMHAETQAPAGPIAVQQDKPGRTVDAPGPSLPKDVSVATDAPGPSLRKDVSVATPEQKTMKPAVPVSGNAAVEAASRALDDAITRRLWTNNDAHEFRQAIVDMPAEERDRLIRQLTTAINNGQIIVRVDRGPPF